MVGELQGNSNMYVGATILSAIFAVITGGVFLHDRWKGSDIEVSDPKQALLYLDGGPQGVTYIAFETTATNASGVPDTTDDTYVLISHADGALADRFDFSSHIRPVFYLPGDQPVACQPLTRCIGYRNMIIADTGSTVVNVGSYSSISTYLSFALSDLNCDPDHSSDCSLWQASGTLPLLDLQGRPHFSVNLGFSGDGNHPIECTFVPKPNRAWGDVIERLGTERWASFDCA